MWHMVIDRRVELVAGRVYSGACERSPQITIPMVMACKDRSDMEPDDIWLYVIISWPRMKSGHETMDGEECREMTTTTATPTPTTTPAALPTSLSTSKFIAANSEQFSWSNPNFSSCHILVSRIRTHMFDLSIGINQIKLYRLSCRDIYKLIGIGLIQGIQFKVKSRGSLSLSGIHSP